MNDKDKKKEEPLDDEEINKAEAGITFSKEAENGD